MGTAMKGAMAAGGIGILLTLLSPLIQKLMEAVEKTKAFQAIMKLVGKAMDEVTKLIDMAWKYLLPYVMMAVHAIGKVIQLVFKAISIYVTTYITIVKTVIMAVWNFIAPFVTTAVTVIWTIIKVVFKAIQIYISTYDLVRDSRSRA
jgi:phage-related protein